MSDYRLTDEECFNKLIRTSLTGEVHVFDETMSKEEIHSKLDNLFNTEEIDYFQPLPNFESISEYRKTINQEDFIELTDEENIIELDCMGFDYYINSQKESIARFKKRHPNGAKIDIYSYEKFLKIGEKLI